MNFELSPRFVQEDFCRLCLCGIYELHPLFPTTTPRGGGSCESNLALVTKISLLAEIIIVPSEELNARICSRCIQQLEDFDSFRRRCKDSDNQIRKIRAFLQSRAGKSGDGGPVTNKGSSSTGGAPPGDRLFGGVFDKMEYCEDAVVPGEHRMLYDGFVYRRESLLVWRCELAICPCQLLVEDDFSKCWIKGAHSHGKIPLSSDKRKFEEMNQRICGFLNELRGRIDVTNQNRSEAGALSCLGGQHESMPKAQPSCTSDIQYTATGHRPSIYVNDYRYYKEATTTGLIPPKIYWRCFDKNCLGMVITTADLCNLKMHMTHNHAPRSIADRSLLVREDCCPVTVSALPMMRASPQPECSTPTSEKSSSIVISDSEIPARQESRPPQVSVVPRVHLIGSSIGTSKSNNTLKTNADTLPKSSSTQPTQGSEHPQADAAQMVTSTAIIQKKSTPAKRKEKSTPPPKPTKKPKKTEATSSVNGAPTSSPLTRENSVMTFYKSPARTYYMRYNECFYYKDYSYHAITNGTNILWRCIVQNCPSLIILSQDMNPVPGLFHNHGPAKCESNQLSPVAARDAVKKLPIVPNITFYRCPSSEGLCLEYQKITYSLRLTNLTSPYLVWECKVKNCGAWMHSGPEFEYLLPGCKHNHQDPATPEHIVDVEHRLPVHQALRTLIELKNKSQDYVTASLSECTVESAQFQDQKSRIGQRRKSTWC